MANKTTAWVTFKAVNKLTAPVRAMSRSIGKMFRDIRKNAKYATRELKVLDRQLNKLTSGLGRRMPGIGLLSGAGLVYGAKEAIETSARLESMETAIRYVSGSAAEGQKNIDFLRQTSRELGLDIEVATEGFKRFSASTKGIESMDDTRMMFKDMSVGMRTLGVDAQAQERIFFALSEMYSKGTIMAQELKIQLGNALPGAYRMLAKSMGVTSVQLKKMMEKGSVVTKKYLKNFTKLMRSEYEGGLAKAQETTSFAMSQISLSWKYMVADIGGTLAGTGVLDHIQVIVDGMHEWIKANKEMIGINLKKGLDKIVSFGKWVIDNWGTIITSVKILVGAFIAFKSVIATMSLVTLLSNPITASAAAIAALIIAMPFLIEEFHNLGKEMAKGKDELNSFETLLLGFGDIWNGLFNVKTTWEGTKTFLVGIAEVLLGIVSLATDAAYALGMMSKATYAERAESREKIVEDMRVWAGYKTPGISKEDRAASGYDSEIKPKRKISPYSISGRDSDVDRSENNSTTTNVLEIRAAKREMEAVYLHKSNAANIFLTDPNGIPYAQ